MKRILVTGGAGFIGSHLCARLLEQGNYVIALDNYYSGAEENIAAIESHDNFEFIKQDVKQPIDLDIDEIYNLACPASPVYYQSDPVETVATNVVGTLNMLRLAHERGVRILQASTSEVYGDPEVHPQPESYNGNVNSIGPRACYDEGKRCAETLCFDYYREYGVDIKVARIFNTYGPNMRPNDGRVVSNFIVQALKGQPITVYGGGKQSRSFCYVDDLVEGLIAMMALPKEETGPINLGNPHETTIAELAQTITQMIPEAVEDITQLPLPTDDPMQRCPDITKAKVLIDWEPKIALEQGLEKTIAYFRNQL